MFGSILSSAVKIASLPLDAVDTAVDVTLCGGDGSVKSRKQNAGIINGLINIRDGIAESCSDIDK